VVEVLASPPSPRQVHCKLNTVLCHLQQKQQLLILCSSQLLPQQAFIFFDTPIRQNSPLKSERRRRAQRSHSEHRRTERQVDHARYVQNRKPSCRRHIRADEDNGLERSGECHRHAGQPSPLCCTQLQNVNGRRTTSRFCIGGGEKNVIQHCKLCSRSCVEHGLAGAPGRR
jgi:hypothetical protein